MQTEAVFDNIGQKIQIEISRAKHTLLIAVAWFTNKNIFNTILLKAQEGCNVSLIIANDSINENSRIDYNEIEKYNGKFYKIGNNEHELMHNKFCIIDNSIVITGSYNWSYKAENNLENIIITYDDTFLAEQFIKEFNSILKKNISYDFDKPDQLPVDIICKRFQIIKNYIHLEEYNELKKELFKLQEFKYNQSVLKIWNFIISNDYVNALKEIELFTKQNQSIILYDDPEMFTLQLDVRVLENQLNAFDNEKIELEKLISDFNHTYTIELGHIILEILKLRKEKFINDKEKAKDAETDFNEFNNNFENEKNKTLFKLTDDEKLELKKKFRKASFLCHPDKVKDELKEMAEKIFIELKKANDTNDLKKVSEILNDLEVGNFFKNNSETITEKEKIKSYITKLKIQLKQIEDEIQKIRNSESYQLILKISDWTEYFTELKKNLQVELAKLKNELSIN